MVELFHNFRLASPGWLAALPLVPLVAVALRGSLARESALRRVATLVLRTTALALLVLALCSPVVDRANHTPWVVLLVDQSESVGAEGLDTAKTFVEEAVAQAGADRVVVIPFASEPGKPSEGNWPELEGDSAGTDLAAAFGSVSSIARLFGPERVVLLSDGNATVSENVPAAAAALQAPVDVVPLPPANGPDVWIESVAAPSEVRPGSPVSMVVTLRATAKTEAILRVACQEVEVARKEITLSEGPLPLPFELELASGPRDVYRVTVESPLDRQQANNWAEFAVWHGEPARALLVGADASRFLRLTKILDREQMEVETITSDRFPQGLGELREYDLVVLADVPATAFTSQQLDAIESYVHDNAGGLIVFGGQNSLTAGDYRETALERVLPVTCEFDVRAKRPSLAMVLVIDQSGSMEEGNAIGLAKTALRQTVGMLDAQDELGVIAFQDTTNWIVPLQPCDNKEKVLREIDTLEAGGGTNMHPAIAKAHLALHEAFADLKHIIVLTDGISYPGDFDTLASEVAASGITISTVAVGSEAAEPLLQAIAELGGGNYHHCTSAAQVPEIFVRETAKAARMGIREEPFFPKAEAALTSIASLPNEKPPTLLGYIQTKARPEAEVGMVSETGDPLVVWWQFGRGQAAVFTSELRGPWTRPWQTWPGRDALWTTLVKQTVRPPNLDGYRLTCKREDVATHVALDAVLYPGRFENEAEVVLESTSPCGSKQQTDMRHDASGRYAAQLETSKPGIYDFSATCTIAGWAVFTGRCSACPAYPSEWIPRAANETLLRELAETTGGRINPPAGELFASDDAPSLETRGLWHYLLLAAIVLLLGELVIRRLSVAWLSRAES